MNANFRYEIRRTSWNLFSIGKYWKTKWNINLEKWIKEFEYSKIFKEFIETISSWNKFDWNEDTLNEYQKILDEIIFIEWIIRRNEILTLFKEMKNTHDAKYEVLFDNQSSWLFNDEDMFNEQFYWLLEDEESSFEWNWSQENESKERIDELKKFFKKEFNKNFQWYHLFSSKNSSLEEQQIKDYSDFINSNFYEIENDFNVKDFLWNLYLCKSSYFEDDDESCLLWKLNESEIDSIERIKKDLKINLVYFDYLYNSWIIRFFFIESEKKYSMLTFQVTCSDIQEYDDIKYID